MLSKTKLQSCITQAIEKLPVLRPLDKLVAINPLEGLTQNNYQSAVKQFFTHLNPGDSAHLDQAEVILIKYLSLLLPRDGANPIITTPHNYATWRCYASYDHNLDKAKLAQFPKESLAAIFRLLSDYSIVEVEQIIHQQLFRCKGWAGLVKYYDSTNQGYLTLTDYLAILLTIKDVLGIAINPKLVSSQVLPQAIATAPKPKDHTAIFKRMTHNANISPNIGQEPDVNFVFCIDVRSELMRKCLESFRYKTIGAAGFFNLAITVESTTSSANYCPVIVNPELSLDGKKLNQARKTDFASLAATLSQGISSLSFVEFFGLHYLFQFIKNSLPKIFKPSNCATSVQFDIEQVITAWQRANKFDYLITCLSAFLKVLNLSDSTPKYVVICGHRADVNNNHFHSKLQCGACGGQSGELNAQLMCALLNESQIRTALKTHNHNISETTRFIPAIHNTAADQLHLLEIDHKNCTIFEQIKSNLNSINASSTMRLQHKYQKYNRNAPTNHDWSETQPDLGLVSNSLFIIADRHITQGIDLADSAFLQNYNPNADTDLSLLTSILEGPVSVALGINMQYNFAALSKDVLSSHSKTTHNLVSTLGVMQGQLSDLRLGLPYEAFSDNQSCFHEPHILSVVIHQTAENIAKVINKTQSFKTYLKHQWLKLYILDVHSNQVIAYEDVCAVNKTKPQQTASATYAAQQ